MHMIIPSVIQMVFLASFDHFIAENKLFFGYALYFGSWRGYFCYDVSAEISRTGSGEAAAVKLEPFSDTLADICRSLYG